jgi:predicted kinase
MAKLYTMVGVPGSGKSTIAKQIPNTVIVSSDSIRKELYGSEEIQGDSKQVFDLVYKRIKEELTKGHDVVFDATNLTPKARKAVFRFNAEHIAIYVSTSLDDCLKRNAARERKVPEEVIYRMYNNIIFPRRAEGFRTVITIST